MTHDIFNSVYSNGLAACAKANIKTDTMRFSFHDEMFELPTLVVHPHAEYNGYFFTIPIDKLRELAAQGK